jgi:hypothetical protein
MLAQVIAPFWTTEEEPFMNALPLPALFGTLGALLIVAIYFVWARKTSKA